jgi:hypothetical protein
MGRVDADPSPCSPSDSAHLLRTSVPPPLPGGPTSLVCIHVAAQCHALWGCSGQMAMVEPGCPSCLWSSAHLGMEGRIYES